MNSLISSEVKVKSMKYFQHLKNELVCRVVVLDILAYPSKKSLVVVISGKSFHQWERDEESTFLRNNR